MDEIKTELRSYWDHVVPASTRGEWCFNQVISCYSSPDRHYHNLHHLHAMLQALEALRALSDENILACLYHDIVYRPGGADNEHRSARVAADSLAGLQVGPWIRKAVWERIMATRDHVSTGRADIDAFLDADMSVLGCPPPEYAEYLRAVRNEYAQFADQAFFVGRQRFLETLQARDQLFLTPAARALWEQQARHNIRWELDLYEKSKEPIHESNGSV